jgi:DNA-binding LytR/AlgR family response regulator
MKWKCVVIDDELEAIEEITEYIANTPDLKLIESFSSPLDALNFINKNQNIDFVFMDVDMPDLNGIDLSKLIRAKVRRLIFTTSHAKYALNAFEVDADAFLLKPFNYAKFISAISKFLHNHLSSGSAEDDYIYDKNKNEDLKLVKVKFEDIVAIESLANYVRIYTNTIKIVTHLKLKEAKEIFGEKNGFMQLHRSFLISKRHINSIEGNTLTMSNGSKFTIGENYRKTINEFLNDKILKSATNKQ